MALLEKIAGPFTVFIDPAQMIADDAMITSTYMTGMGYFIQKGFQLNDSGFLKTGSWPVFQPQNVWLIKK